MAFRDWTAAQRGALVEDLTTNAAALGIDGASDAGAAAALGAPTSDGVRRVPTAALKHYFRANLHSNGRVLLVLLRELAARAPDPLGGAPTQGQIDAAVLALDAVGDAENPDIDVTSRTAVASLDLLLAAGAIEPEHADAIAAMGAARISRAEARGYPAPHHLDIAAARGRG